VQGGFAILENVLFIYDAYLNGELARDGYTFPPGLSFKRFAAKYFDYSVMPVRREKKLALFHARTLSRRGGLISWNDVGDFSVGNPRFVATCSQSRGCIFLNRGFDHWPEVAESHVKHCILHRRHNNTCLTPKPIQCVFFICAKPGEPRHPSTKLAAQWYRALAEAYPNSVERFRQLTEG
jgi:hypothetical protein